MTIELILSILSICFSILAIILFSLFPWIKKVLFFSINKRLDFLIETYLLLNPIPKISLETIDGEIKFKIKKMDEIKHFLLEQSIFRFGFPKYHKMMIKNEYNFDIFWFNNFIFFDNLEWIELIKIWTIWKQISKKISYIFKYIAKYDYIMKDNDGECCIKDRFEMISLTTISLCNSFFPLNPNNSISQYYEYKEQKITKDEFKKIKRNENISRKAFIKELKSSKFSINFMTNIKIDNLSYNNYPYYFVSLEFSNEKKEFKNNLNKNKFYKVTNDIKIKIKEVDNWINSIFQLN